MRLHVKLKEFLSMFFMAILFFPAFNASLFFTGVKPLYSIIKCSTEIFYDWRMLILCFGFMSFSFLNVHVILLTIIKSFLIKKTKVVNFATDITIQLTLIFLLIAIVIAPLIAPFVTGYVNVEKMQHSYPCCWRHKTPIIFRATPQWFVSMDQKGLRAQSLKEIKGVQWIPDWVLHRDYAHLHGLRFDHSSSRRRLCCC